jgi:hypothetical protein
MIRISIGTQKYSVSGLFAVTLNQTLETGSTAPSISVFS